MPVKRIIKSFESMPNQWFTSAIDINKIDNKSKSNPIVANSEPNNSEDNGYKTALNESVVDDLVSTLTTKLCLKSNHRLCRLSRLSPYQIHNSSTYRSAPNNSCYCLDCKYLIHSNTTNSKTGLKRSSSMSDTYELMQQLLKEGSLIKEAVKRLQFEGRQPLEDKKQTDFYEDCSEEEFNQNENQLNFLNS